MYKQATFLFSAGKVVLTENVLRHHASATYDLSITANDGYNTIGPRTLTVNINGMYISERHKVENIQIKIYHELKKKQKCSEGGPLTSSGEARSNHASVNPFIINQRFSIKRGDLALYPLPESSSETLVI